MASRYEVTLNNVTMASLDSSIVIHDVRYEEPIYERNTFSIARQNGSRVSDAYKRRTAVTIVFEVREYGIDDRQGVVLKVINWAKNGGDLRINDRPNQKLICICEKHPYIDSVLRWTNELFITFAAYECPYWQSATDLVITDRYSKATTTDKEATFKYYTMDVPGDAPYVTPKSIVVEGIQNTASSTTEIYVEMKNTTRNDGFMAVMPYLPASTTGTFEYSYDDKNIMKLQMRYGTTVQHLFGRYSPYGKAYEIYLNSGAENNFGISITKREAGTSSNTYYPFSCDVTITWRGLWE